MWAAALPLAYHADDEIARVETVGYVVLGVLLAVVGFVLMWRIRGAPRGRNRLARLAAVVAAIGIGAYGLLRWAPLDDDPSGVALALLYLVLLLPFVAGVAGPVLAVTGLGRVAMHGERSLAVLAFVSSLVVPGLFVVSVVACVITDACFH